MRAEGEAGALRHALHLDLFRLEAFRGPLRSIRGTWVPAHRVQVSRGRGSPR